jgi:hypothetical protein
MAALLPVAFHGDTLYLVEHHGEPFAPVKPICEAIGLDWKGQHDKLTARFRATIGLIPIVAADGKTREMVCLPLRKLPGWLYSLSPAKVAPAHRAKVEAYQAECDDALWRYWTEGHARRPAAPMSAARFLLEHAKDLLNDLEPAVSQLEREAEAAQAMNAPAKGGAQ